MSKTDGVTAPLIRQAMSLGRAVDEGVITRDEAIASLTRWSDGGLTPLGAADLIDNWKTYDGTAK